jgi:uncharacterized protein DUF4907
MMKKKTYVVLVVTILLACNSANDWQVAASITEKSKVQMEIIELSTGNYGYAIRQNGKLLVEQKHIPAIQQFKPFVNRRDTEKVGMLVKKKLEQNIFPPTISVGELDSLGISY